MKTGFVIDVMANISKMKTPNVRTFGELCDNNYVECDTVHNKGRIKNIFSI